MQNRLAALWQQIPPKQRLEFSTVLSGLIYLAFTLPFPLNRYYAVTPPVDYAKLTHYSILGFCAYVVAIITLFGMYLIGLRSLMDRNLDITESTAVRFVLLSGVAFALMLVFSYPQTAIDLFVYALRTRGWALYGLSPFSTTPETFPTSDPWLGLAGEWADAASPYGPVWEWLSLGAYHLSGGSYLGHLYALKIIAVLAYLGSAWLVYRILCLFRPQWAVVGTAFFTWNPLVLLESVQNAHNDIVMVFFLLLAIWAYAQMMLSERNNRWFSVIFIAAFALSILVKFVSLLVLPFFLLGLAIRQATWTRRIGLLLIYGLVILSIVILVTAPSWPGLENWAVLRVGKGAGRSLFAFLVLTMIPHVSTAAAFDIISALIYAAFGGIYLWGLWKVIRLGLRDSSAEVGLETSILVSFYVFFWYVLIVASVFHAWYLLWFMPLTALLIPAVRPSSGAVVFSLAALLIIPYYETIRVWIPYLNQNHWLGHLIGVSLLFVPVLLTLWKPPLLIPDEDQA